MFLESKEFRKEDLQKLLELLVQKSITIFKDVLYDWEPVVNIFDKSLSEINKMVINDKLFHNDLIDCFNSYSLFGSLGWEYFFFTKSIVDTQNHFTLQTQHRHLICQVLDQAPKYLKKNGANLFVIHTKIRCTNNI